METIMELKGMAPGPVSMIVVGVHGNERCGLEALDELLPTLAIEKGTVFIGYGNPRAIEQNVRFTEVNLNRMFKPDTLLTDAEKDSYEYKRAQFLKKYFDQSEVLLDVHASFTPESRVFVIAEPHANEVVRYLPVPLVVHGFDAVEPGGTDYYMNTTGKIGICIECGYLGDLRSTAIAKESIVSFLVARGHMSGEAIRQEQSYLHMYELYVTKTNDFKLAKQFADFEALSKGTVIGTDGEEEIRAEKDSIVLFARNRNKRGEEAFLLGEYI